VTLNFSFESIQSTEFGIGRDDEGEGTFSLIPVDENVQNALKEMAADTWETMHEKGDPDDYQPSEKYASQEYVYISTDDDLAARLRDLHRANNLSLNAAALEEPEAIFCYFAKFSDSRKRRLTAVRRATQFKGILKHRLIQFVTDALKLVEDDTFKLDSDFDLLIDSATIHILRPSGFEFIAELQEAIREAVPDNVATIQKDMPFVDFSNIEEYAASHTRAARYLSSIRSQRETQNISQRLLKKACKAHGVDLQMKNGKITVLAGSEMEFLDILDRRMYELELVEGSPERYRAGSRRKIGKS
jgi:hypothetical protein